MRKKRHYLFIFMFGAVFIASIIWMIEIISGMVPYVDQWTIIFVEALGGTKVYFLFRWLTELGSENFLVPFAGVMAVLLWRLFRDWLPGIMFAGGILLSHLLNMFIKVLVKRDRPRIFIAADAEGYGFPSGHAMISLVCYGLLAYFLGKKIKSMKWLILLHVGSALLIFLIGVSRYMIQVHYLTDVVAGYLFGFIFIMIWIRFYIYIQNKRQHGVTFL